jgi:hypothetical protein
MKKEIENRERFLRPIRLAYQPPANDTFLSEQTSHQQPASSTFLSEQTSSSHQPPAKRTGCTVFKRWNVTNIILFFSGFMM